LAPTTRSYGAILDSKSDRGGNCNGARCTTGMRTTILLDRLWHWFAWDTRPSLRVCDADLFSSRGTLGSLQKTRLSVISTSLHEHMPNCNVRLGNYTTMHCCTQASQTVTRNKFFSRECGEHQWDGDCSRSGRQGLPQIRSARYCARVRACACGTGRHWAVLPGVGSAMIGVAFCDRWVCNARGRGIRRSGHWVS
jgi:hypothetical protein